MWMAVALICSGGIKEGSMCYTSMSSFLFKSEQACMEAIAEGANSGMFYSPPLPGEIEEWIFADLLCYNWLEENKQSDV